MDDIFQRAAQVGVETQFWDGLGHLHTVDVGVLSRLLDVMGENRNRRNAILPPWVVIRGNCIPAIPLAVPAGLPFRWEIVSDRVVAHGEATTSDLTLPPGLRCGIFGLRVIVTQEQAHLSEEKPLLVCPQQAYQGEPTTPQRMWALAVQLYGVRSLRNWGHGDFSDLIAIVNLAADLGASGVGLNPLHAGFDDQAQEPSPYYPSSRFFLNSLYIDVEAIPEFPGIEAAGLTEKLALLRNRNVIDYHAVAQAKLIGLRLAHEAFRKHASPQRRNSLASFLATHPLPLARFACFELLRRRFTGPWWEWPEEWRRADASSIARLHRDEPEVGFFEFVQWVAHEQLERCQAAARARGMPIGLYLDVAVGVRSDGFDAWCDQDAVLAGMAIGAPPDNLNTGGQNWGLAGLNPLGLEQQRFEPFHRLLRAAMQYAGAVRLDHVLGLQRLYLVPHGIAASQGTYIHLPFEALLATAALASVQNRCLVIGEDLGTVPDNFRETLADWGIWSYQVMLFERVGGGGFAGPESYRHNALVTFATHDLPTFAGWHAHRDLAVKRALNINPGESDSERNRARECLQEALRRHGIAGNDFAAVAKYLAVTPSRLLVISMEDLLGVTEQVNLPGTVDEHPNWRQPLPVTIEELRNHPGLTVIADIMRSAGRSLQRVVR
ncbi:MAG: 4-alpha-glucanotransferase [Alphaproteobacteria bacterium]|nr:MAG: 4-alpha-glucanotransferase [Alphaproteobacteria bacterium]